MKDNLSLCMSLVMSFVLKPWQSQHTLVAAPSRPPKNPAPAGCPSSTQKSTLEVPGKVGLVVSCAAIESIMIGQAHDHVICHMMCAHMSQFPNLSAA